MWVRKQEEEESRLVKVGRRRGREVELPPVSSFGREARREKKKLRASSAQVNQFIWQRFNEGRSWRREGRGKMEKGRREDREGGGRAVKYAKNDLISFADNSPTSLLRFPPQPCANTKIGERAEGERRDGVSREGGRMRREHASATPQQ